MTKLNNIVYFLKKLLQYKLLFFLLFFTQVASAVLPIALTWCTAEIIGRVAIASPTTETLLSLLFVGCFGILFLTDAISILHEFLSSALEERLSQKLRGLCLKKIGSHPTLEFFDNHHAAAGVSLAKKSLENLDNAFSTFSYFCVGMFSFIPTFFLLFHIGIWIPFIALATTVPLILVRAFVQKKTWDVRKNYAPIFRQIDNYEEMLTLPHYAKDLRLYSMSARVHQTWEKAYSAFFYSLNAWRFKGGIAITLLSIISALGLTLCFYSVTIGTLQGVHSIQKLSFLFGIIIQFESSANQLVHNWDSVGSLWRAFTPILTVLSRTSFCKGESVSAHPCADVPLLEFRDVSFSYDQGGKESLSNISFQLFSYESLALIGENGSGKSTLIKLICRFYQPQRGCILWNGQNIQHIDFSAYRAKLGALFQDFAQFPLSVRQNMDVRAQDFSGEKLRTNLEQVSLEQKLGNKLDAPLTRGAEEGLQLSGGQWQRLALTRLLSDLENTDLLLLDEPTAALDPHAEHQIMELIRTMAEKKPAVVVSHRLALTRFMDKILVLEKGLIKEIGSHQKLQARGGLYSAMFRKQASYYT